MNFTHRLRLNYNKIELDLKNSLYLQKTNIPMEMTYLATRTYLANIIPGFTCDCPRCNPPETTLHAIRTVCGPKIFG